MPRVVLLHTGGTLMMRATVAGDSSSPLGRSVARDVRA